MLNLCNEEMTLFCRSSDVERIESVPIEQRIPYASVQELFTRRAQTHADQPAVIWLPNGLASDDPTIISYRDLARQITQAANLFRGLTGGDATVSVLMPNRPETYYAIWGASVAGTANPINPLLSPQQIAEIIRAAGSRILVAGGPECAYDVFQKAHAVRALCPQLEHVLFVDRSQDDAADFATALRAQPDDSLLIPRKIAPDDPSVYFHTGGTTGTPKLAQQTHRNQLFTAWSCSYLMDLTSDDRLLTGLPLFHANAAIATGLSGFFVGAATVLCGERGYRDKQMLANFWRIARRYDASVFSGVPTVYSALLEQLGDSSASASLRFGLCGAAPMPVSVLRDFEHRTGIRILEAYGMTEGGALSTINPRDGERRVGSIGLRAPYQGVRPAILDENGAFIRDCATDEVGHLLLSGPNIFPGYKQEAHNSGIWALPGWFNSGDLGRRDADGYFWLAGRAKDLIIRSGHNIDPAMIEECLKAHSDVALAAAIGAPDPYAGEIPIAYVTLSPGSTITADELCAFARTTVAERPAAPAEIIIIDEMPVTAVGKIFKPALRLDAVARVLGAQVAEFGLEVEALSDPKRGIVASIIGQTDAESASQIRKRLGRFAIPFEFTPSVQGDKA